MDSALRRLAACANEIQRLIQRFASDAAEPCLYCLDGRLEPKWHGAPRYVLTSNAVR